MKLKEILSSRLFLKRFAVLAGIIFLLFTTFALYTYRNSRNALRDEFLSYSYNQTERISSSVDDFILTMRRVMSMLYTDKSVRTFFNQKDPEQVITGINQLLLNQISAYQYGFTAVDSIYLYSAASGIVLNDSAIRLDNLSDRNWAEHLPESEEKYILFPRKKNGRFPFLLTLMKTLETQSGPSAVVININLAKLAQLTELTDAGSQSVYVVSQDGEILFRPDQTDIPEALSSVSELASFDASADSGQIFIDSGQSPYIYTQYRSKSYPWTYVMITYLKEYSSRLTGERALILTFFFFLFFLSLIPLFAFVFHSTRPMQAILNLLKKEDRAGGYSDADIRDAVEQIMTYIQKNKVLSEQLESRMELLNKTRLLALQSQINPHFLFNTLNMIHILEIDSLGYDHIAPKLTLTLSRLLSYALESTDLVSLETEFHYTEQFLLILNQRYNNRLRIQTVLAKEAAPAKVPKLLIQPLIENAVFHGLAAMTGPENHLDITAECMDESGAETFVLLTVRDNGIGIPPEKLEELRAGILNTEESPSGSIGLQNVALRMRLLFGERFHMEIESALNEGTAIVLAFPFME